MEKSRSFDPRLEQVNWSYGIARFKESTNIHLTFKKGETQNQENFILLKSGDSFNSFFVGSSFVLDRFLSHL